MGNKPHFPIGQYCGLISGVSALGRKVTFTVNLPSCFLANMLQYRRCLFVSADQLSYPNLWHWPENGLPADSRGLTVAFYGAFAGLASGFSSLAAPTSSSRDKSVQKVPSPA